MAEKHRPLTWLQEQMLKRLENNIVVVYGIRQNGQRSTLLSLVRRGFARELDRADHGRRFAITEEGSSTFRQRSPA
jgi:hypothetical protein